MVADALDHGHGARIAHREALATATVCEEASARGAVQAGVAHDGIQVGLEAVSRRWLYDDFPPAHALAHVVVGLAREDQTHAGRKEGPEALARAALEEQFERAFGEAGIAPLVANFARHLRADGPVGRMPRTSSATLLKKLTIISGVPLNLARRRSSWLAIPTGQVFKWHWRT